MKLKTLKAISLFDLYFLVVTLAYLVWRVKVIWERMNG